jgi:hypothetical protein
MTPTEERLLTYDVAEWLHQRMHKSTKTLSCRSDLSMATSIVAMLKERTGEEHQREGVSARVPKST